MYLFTIGSRNFGYMRKLANVKTGFVSTIPFKKPFYISLTFVMSCDDDAKDWIIFNSA